MKKRTNEERVTGEREENNSLDVGSARLSVRGPLLGQLVFFQKGQVLGTEVGGMGAGKGRNAIASIEHGLKFIRSLLKMTTQKSVQQGQGNLN